MEYIEGSHIHGDEVYVDDYHLDEKWAYIYGFPGYMISNKGRVWSTKTKIFLKNKQLDDHEHLGVGLYKDGTCHYKYIHRLVADAFIPNPNNLPIVRHLYDDSTQNTVDDIEWGTQKDNMLDAINNKTFYYFTDEDRYFGNENRMIPVVAINLNTNEELYFRSQGEASRELKIPQGNIWKVLNNQRSTAGGYIFRKGDVI